MSRQRSSLRFIVFCMMSQEQHDLLAWVLRDRYPVARVVAATDADSQGERYAEQICALRHDAERHPPPMGKDWNDTLNQREAL